MKYTKFKEIILLLRQSSNVVDKSTKYVQTNLFDEHNKLISSLLEAIYEPAAVSNILYEWLIGNTSPLRVTVEGVTVSYPLKTMKDLYRVMEMYKLD